MNFTLGACCRLTVCLSAVLILLSIMQVDAAENGVILTLRSCQDVYALHEPVQLIGELRNGSDHAVQLHAMEWLSDENMPFLFLEIINPNGVREQRRTCYSLRNVVFMTQFKGETFWPGETYGIDLFPNQTYFIGTMEGGWTFPTVGKYQVRLVYEVSPRMKNLWKAPGNRLYSNKIMVDIVEPSLAQKEILDAYWKDSISNGMTWDGKRMEGFDRGELNRVLQKYPDEPFIKYPLFALLNLESVMAFPDLEKATIHAQYLMSKYPDFRRGQVRRAYAAALIGSGRKAEGLKVLEDALTLEPRLKDNLDFMKLKVGTEKGSEEAFWLWQRHRKMTAPNENKQPKQE